jgi:Transposase DNA-binding/Transposase Tn5 dimerisation domain
MDIIADPRTWAEQTFAAADLGDVRRTRRLVTAAAAIARHPEKSFTQAFDWNDLRGFYRLCDQKEATLKAVQGPHWQRTRQAMRQIAVVLILHDTTELDFTHHPALQGVGPLGEGTTRGFLQHNSLAVDAGSRRLLGLAYQQLRIRQPAPANETSYQRRRRTRESDLWLEGIRASGPAPEDCCWVDVGDRGSDMYEAMVAAREVGHHFLFRLAQNRRVFLSAQQEAAVLLLDHARGLPSQGCDTVEIPARGGRPARVAQVQLAGGPSWIPAAAEIPNRAAQPILPAWVVRIWEPDPPPGVEPLEWLLGCSLATNGLAQLRERRDWYACRWMDETYHDIEKNGCSEEDRRFETAERMETCLAVLSLVAVRVFQLRCALQSQAREPAEQVGTAEEIDLLCRHLRHNKLSFTVKDFVYGVARLGGFLARKNDGDPGVRTLWRGYQRLQDMVTGYQLVSPIRSGTK